MQLDRRTVIAATTGLAAAGVAGAIASPESGSGAKSAVEVQRLGWAGIRLVQGNTTLFLDATVNAQQSPGDRPDPPLVAATAHRYAAVTHAHTDHFDRASLKSVLGESGILLAERSVAQTILAPEMRLQVADMYQPQFVSRSGGEFVLFAVPAVDGLGLPQVSWVIDFGGRRLFHAGDTLWHGYWWDIRRAFGPFELAFLPINGFQQREGRYTNPGHPQSLTPDQAADAARLIGARSVCPIHYGAHGDPDYVEIDNALSRFKDEARRRGIGVTALNPGETMTL